MRTAERLKEISARLDIPLIFKSSFSQGQPQLARVLPRARPRGGPARCSRRSSASSICRSSRTSTIPYQAAPAAEVCDVIQIPGVPVHAVGARGRGRQDRRRRQHQARPVLGAREHGQARQEDRGLRQRPHHRHGARLYVRLQRPRRRSAQLLLAESDRLSRSCSTRATRSASTASRARTRKAARGSSSRRSRAPPWPSGVDGFFIEAHPSPPDALCDAASQYALDDLESFMRPLIDIHNLVRSQSVH